jgi:hypothetical protein
MHSGCLHEHWRRRRKGRTSQSASGVILVGDEVRFRSRVSGSPAPLGRCGANRDRRRDRDGRRLSCVQHLGASRSGSFVVQLRQQTHRSQPAPACEIRRGSRRQRRCMGVHPEKQLDSDQARMVHCTRHTEHHGPQSGLDRTSAPRRRRTVGQRLRRTLLPEPALLPNLRMLENHSDSRECTPHRNRQRDAVRVSHRVPHDDESPLTLRMHCSITRAR